MTSDQEDLDFSFLDKVSEIADNELDFTSLDNSDDLKFTMGEAVKVDPDRRAKVLDLSKKTGIPSFAVENNIDEVETTVKKNEFNFTDLDNNNPETSKFLSNYDNAVIAQDDIPVLSAIENVFKIFTGNTFKDVAEGTVRSLENVSETIPLSFEKMGAGFLLRGVDTAPDQIDQLIPVSALPIGVDISASDLSIEFAKSFGVESDEQLQQAKIEGQEKLINEIIDIESKISSLTPKDLNILQQGLRGGVESLAQMAPGFGLMLASGGRAAPMLAAMYIQTTSGSYAEARAAGLTPDVSFWKANIDGGIEVLTEILPTAKLEKILTGKSTGKLTKEAIKFMIQEQGTEQLATLGQSLNSYLFGLDEEMNNAKSISEMIAIQTERQAVTVVATFVAGGAQIGAVTGIRKTIEKAADALAKDSQQKEQRGEVEQQNIDKLKEQIDKSELRKRSPETFKQFVEQADGDNNTKVFIDSDRVDEFLQTKTIDEINNDEALTELAKQLDEATALKIDIQVPVADFATNFNDEIFTQLRDGMTMSEDAVAPFRQEKNTKEVDKRLKSLMEEAKNNASDYVDAQEITDAIREQLIDTGVYSPEVASTMAELVPLYFAAKAEREGITVKQAYESYGFRVEGPQTGEKARLSAEALEQESDFNRLDDLLKQYDEAFELTEPDFVNEIESLIDDSNIDTEGKLSEAVSAYRKEQDDDFKLGGRNDMDQAFDNFKAVVDDVFKQSATLNKEVTKDERNNANEGRVNSTGQKTAAAEKASTQQEIIDETKNRTRKQALAEYERAVKGETVTFVHRTSQDFKAFDDSLLGTINPEKTPSGSLGHYMAAADLANLDKYGDLVTVYEFKLENPIEISQESFEDTAEMTHEEVAERRQQLMDMGHDGILVKDLNWAIVFEGKTATKLEEDTSVLDDIVLEQPVDDLFIAHNLSAENIIAADELGGLAAPSLATARTTTGGFDNFGEVTLIADKSLLKDKKARTFDADIYSPRQPRPVYKINYDMYRAFERQLDPDNLGLSTPDINSLEDTTGADNFLRSTAVEYRWLQSQNKAPKLKKSKVEPFVRKAEKLGLSSIDMVNDEKFIEMVTDYYRGSLDALTEDGFDVRAEKMTDWYFNEDGTIKQSKLRDKASEVQRFRNSNGFDVHKLRDDISKKMRVKKNRDEYQQWAAAKFNSFVTSKKLFKGYTPSGNRKYSDYNLQNVVKEMTQQLQAGESFFYGAGTVRSKYANELKTIAQIQAKRENIVSEEDMKKVKEESSDVFMEALDALRPFYKFDSDSFGYSDDAGNAIIEGRKGLNETFDMTKDAQKIVDDLVEYLSALPTSYFETKIQRAVGFNEFNTAVVPRGMRKDALQVLKDAGLKIKTYDPKDNNSRTNIIAKQKQLLFQEGKQQARGYYDPANSVIRMTESANLSTFLHEFAHFMYEMEVKGDTNMLKGINAWYKRNAADVAKEANGYLGDKRDVLEQGGELSTETEAFKKWFKGSKIKMLSGEPMIVYHGTNVKVNKEKGFEFDKGKFNTVEEKGDYVGEGFFFAQDKLRAKAYADQAVRNNGGESVVVPAYLSIKNPLIINSKKDSEKLREIFGGEKEYFKLFRKNPKALREKLQSLGYDGLMDNSYGQYAAFDSNQIKSVENIGTFDPTNPDIYKQETTPPTAKEGSITVDDVIAFLDLKTTGDKSKDVAIRRAVHEQFARGFETYLMEGKAPSIELRNIFRTFARWLAQVYKSMRSKLNVNLDDGMRQIFDRLVATEDQIAAAEARAQFKPMFTDAVMAGMTEKQFEDYKAQKEKVKGVQSETLRDKLIKQLRRQTEKWWQEEKQDIVDTETEKLKKERVYAARDKLKSVTKNKEFDAIGENLNKEITELNKQSDDLSKRVEKLKKENDTIGQFISKQGGLNRAEMIEEGVDPESFKERFKVFGKPLFPRKGGMTIDGLAEKLNEIGYKGGNLSANDTLEIVLEMLSDDNSYVNQDAGTEISELNDKLDAIGASIDNLKNDIAEFETASKQISFKLDHAAVKEMVGEERINKLGNKSVVIPPELSGMTAKGKQGVHPDEAAAFLGYSSGSEMIDDLINAPKLKTQAEENAQAAMIERHGDIFTDGTIEREADEAVRSEERGKLILSELKTLAKGTNAPTIDRSTIKELAITNIGKLSFREIQPGKYRKAEIRAAQEAATMLAAGNREGAAAAKLRQVMNYYLGIEATNAKNETMKIVDRMARYNKKKVREQIIKAENDYWEQIAKILNRFEFRKAATLKQVDSLNLWVKERTEADGDGLILSNTVLNETYVTHWKNVPFSDLQGVADSVKNIEHVARYANKIQLQQEEIDFKKLKQDWIDSINENDARFPTKETRSRIDDARKATMAENVRRWASQLTKVPFLASWLDGGARTGLSQDILMQQLTDALDAKMKLIDDVATPVLEAINNRSKEDQKRHAKKIWIPEINDNLMGHQILAVALNVGNQGNMKKMLLGEGWADPEVDTDISINNPKLAAILGHMSKSDWVLVQSIWDQMNLLYPQLAEVHRRTTGLTPPKVESVPFEVVVNGETIKMNGGYYPVKYSPKRSFKAEKNAEKRDAETESMFNNTASIQSSVNTGATNERTGFYDRVELSLSVVPNHFNETIHYITHHDAVRQINRLIQSPDVANAITAVLGEAEFNQLKPWLNDVAKDGRQQPVKGFINEAFGKLRFGVTLGVMGFKASTGIMQVYGLFTTAADVGIGPTLKGVQTSVGRSWYMNAVRKTLGSTNDMQSAWDFAAERSKVLPHRMQTMDREIKNAMERLRGKSGFIAAVQETSMKHIALIQTYIVDLPTWHAAYTKELSESGDESKAIKRADWSVENLQGSGAVKDMASVLRNQTKIHTTFTMFMTFFSSLGNLSRDVVKGARTGQYSKTTVAAKLMFLFTLPVFFEMLMRGDLDEPEDEDDRLSKFLINSTLYPITSVPFVRDVAAGLIGDFGYNSSPVASVLERGILGLKQVSERAFTDEEITKSAAKNVSKLAAASIGLPGINQVWSTGEHLYDVLEEGEDLTIRELLFGPDRN